MRAARLLLAAGLFAAASPVGAPAAGAAAEGPALPDNPLAGRLLFEERHCSDCHAIADRREALGPDLGRSEFSGSFLDLGAAMWNHVPGMSVRFESAEIAWPEITSDEAVRLVAFLYYLRYLGRPGDPAAGKQAFASKGCAACHGLGGAKRSVGPDLTRLKDFASPLYVAQAIWNHGPAMLESMRGMRMTPPTFREGDLADLSAYVRQAAAGGTIERMLLSPGNPNEGRVVFEAKGCSACHSLRGKGGAGGPDLGGSDFHQSAEAIAGRMWNHALDMSEAMRERGVGWPSLTTTELADLIAFLYFLPFADRPGDPRRGEKVFADRTCMGCHAPDAGAAHQGPDLAGTQAVSAPEALVAAMWNHAPVMREAILGEGRPWPELTGDDLRDLLAYLRAHAPEP